MSVALLSSTVAVALWFVFVVYQFNARVQSDGSWYNQLKMNDRDTYINRLKYTVAERVDVGRTLALTFGIAVIIFGLTFVFVTGVLALI